MNPSFGEESSAPRGRAQVPGPGSGGGYEPPVPTSPAAGRAGVGGAWGRDAGGGVGRASVGAGRAGVGTASVGAGRASVGSAAVGSAGVGRAAVRPGNYAGPDGPRRAGVAGIADRLGRGGGKKNRRRNIIIAALAVLVMLAGLTVVGGTYFFDSVTLSPQMMANLSQPTTVYYADGKHAMARLGQNGEMVKIKQIPLYVRQAVISAEDRSFLVNNGVDFKGIARAAVNNFTGGNRQGASTITQQYARKVADLSGITYSRKLREAVIAMKISQRYTKDKIMEMYLNTVYFGRGATGIQAASQAYFRKNVGDLTPAEGMVLAAVIKQPEKDDSPGGAPGYDPANSLKDAQDRWEYVRQGMVTLHFMTPDQAAKLTYPKTWQKTGSAKAGEFGMSPGDKEGNIVNQVRAELSKAGIKDLRNPGGLKIYTTIDYAKQKAAEAAADRTLKSSPLHGQPKYLQSALVAIDPLTGHVVAYYGGNDPTGTDYAGINYSPSGPWGGHQPGSSFKAYVLAAALDSGISLQSVWDGASPRKFPTRVKPVVNAEGDCKSPCRVTLTDATVQSLNTVYYALTAKLGKEKVLEMAAKAGVRNMWDTNRKLHDISTPEGRAAFDNDAGIGKFQTTVLDNAAGYATFASGGYNIPAHFVRKVVDSDGQIVYGERYTPKNVFQHPEVIGDMDEALRKVLEHGGLHQDGHYGPNTLDGGRPAAGKTGTWDFNDTKHDLHVWQAGYTPQLSAVVWIGPNDKDRPIYWNVQGMGQQDMFGSGLPAAVWKQFMDAALSGAPVKQLPSPVNSGDPNAGELPANSATSQQSGQPGQPGGGQPGQGACTIPILCPPAGGGGGGGGGGTGVPVPTDSPAPLPPRRH